MKQKYLILYAAAFIGLVASCNGSNAQNNDNQTDSIEEVDIEEVYIPETDEEPYTPGVEYSEGVIGNSNNGDGRTSQGAYIDYLESVGQDNGSDNNTYNHSDYYGD